MIVFLIISCTASVLFKSASLPDPVTYRQVTYRLLPRKTSVLFGTRFVRRSAR